MTTAQAIKKLSRATLHPRKTKNRKMLRAVAKRLRSLRHEEHYDQSTYGMPTECGTAACIAGHALVCAGLPFRVLIEEGRPYLPSIGLAAKSILGLSNGETNLLFNADYSAWPDEFSDRIEAGERPSRVAADLLDAVADDKVIL